MEKRKINYQTYNPKKKKLLSSILFFSVLLLIVIIILSLSLKQKEVKLAAQTGSTLDDASSAGILASIGVKYLGTNDASKWFQGRGIPTLKDSKGNSYGTEAYYQLAALLPPAIVKKYSTKPYSPSPSPSASSSAYPSSSSTPR